MAVIQYIIFFIIRQDQFSFNDTEVAPDKEVLLVEAMFTGIVKETMSKFSDRAQEASKVLC